MKMFTDKEALALDFVLSKANDTNEGFHLEELHGFLFGLAVTPEDVMPSEWFPVVFGKGSPAFNDKKEAQVCIEHLMKVYNRFMNDVRRGTLRFPFNLNKIDKDYDLVEGWAYGLFEALSLRPNLWGMSEEYENMPDEDISADMLCVINACCIITAIALPEERGVSLNSVPGHELKSKEEIFKILYKMLPACVETILKHGEMLREKKSPGRLVVGNDNLRFGLEVGRNEPCPCGSGKKYKKCCGNI